MDAKTGLVLMPPVVVLTTFATFLGLTALLGHPWGYLCGFPFYWAVWGVVAPARVMGWAGVRAAFGRAPNPFGKPVWAGVVMLAAPPLFTALFVFPKRLPDAGLVLLAASAAAAVVNGLLEELLWRGQFVRAFPGDPVRAVLYPALGFALYHLAPLSVHPTRLPGGTPALLVGALLAGLGWGWVAYKTGSIRWTSVSHVLVDFLGLWVAEFLRNYGG